MLLVLAFTSTGLPQTPIITAIHPDPVIGANFLQSITLIGTNFSSNCVVTLREKDHDLTFTRRMIESYSNTNLTVKTEFTSVPANWAEEVVNPNGANLKRIWYLQSTSIWIVLPCSTTCHNFAFICLRLWANRLGMGKIFGR
jgi:hypothetical protein